MTTVIIPTRGRPEMLARCLASLWGVDDGLPGRTVVIVDDHPDTVADLWEEFDWVEWWYNGSAQRGFWQSINWVLRSVAEKEPFCYFGKDVVFRDGWLAAAEHCWQQRFPDGLGLLAFQDDKVNEGNASHGMTTRAWLWVVNGEPFFPRGFWHHHCDSDLTVRSKDLKRFMYCPASHVPHLHEPTGHEGSVKPEQLSDYDLNNLRHTQWHDGEWKQAQARLREMAG